VCDALGLSSKPTMEQVYDPQFLPPMADRKFA